MHFRHAVVMLISWTAWSGRCVLLMYKSWAIFWADFLVIKSTYTRVNTVLKIDEKISDYSSFIADMFLSELQETEWSHPFNNDENKSFTTFYKKKNSLIYKHLKMKTLSKCREKILSQHGKSELQHTKKVTYFLMLIGKTTSYTKRKWGQPNMSKKEKL